jgi:hypothetical protein
MPRLNPLPAEHPPLQHYYMRTCLGSSMHCTINLLNAIYSIQETYGSAPEIFLGALGEEQPRIIPRVKGHHKCPMVPDLSDNAQGLPLHRRNVESAFLTDSPPGRIAHTTQRRKGYESSARRCRAAKKAHTAKSGVETSRGDFDGHTLWSLPLPPERVLWQHAVGVVLGQPLESTRAASHSHGAEGLEAKVLRRGSQPLTPLRTWSCVCVCVCSLFPVPSL